MASETNRQIVSAFGTITLFYFKPVVLLLDLFGHVFCFIALYKQRKSDKTYSFQFYEAMSKCLDTFGGFINLIFYQWFINIATSPDAWYKKVYGIAWFSAAFGVAFYDITTCIKLFVALGMTMDRLYALANPLGYKCLNRKKWEGITIGGSVGISILIHIYELNYYKAEYVESLGVYRVVQNAGYTSQVIVQFLVVLRIAVYIAAMLALTACGIKVIILYKKKNDKAAAMIIDSTSDQAKSKVRRQNEQTLFLLTIFKSFQITTEFLFKIIHTALSGWKIGFQACEAPLFISVRHMVVTLINSLDFYVMMYVSRQFRDMMKRTICWKKNNVDVVGAK